MDISVKGKNLDVGDSLRGHVEASLEGDVSKYFNNALDANVIISREGRSFRADISVHAGRGFKVQGHASADDVYAAFDSALTRIAKQLRRYKRRIQDHHKGQSEEDILRAQYSIIAAEGEEEEVHENDQPVVIADMPHEIATLTVGEAVMRMDLANSPAMMFRNRANGSFNVVYRREDGNVGWIDPSNTEQS